MRITTCEVENYNLQSKKHQNRLPSYDRETNFGNTTFQCFKISAFS